MGTSAGSEELLIDIESNSRIRLFSFFAIYSFTSAIDAEMGFVLKDGSGGSDIYSSGVTYGNKGASTLYIEPLSQIKLPEPGIVSFSDLYLEGIGNYGLKALTVFYQVG